MKAAAERRRMDPLSREILREINLDEAVPAPRRPKPPVDHWTTSVLLERAAYLRKMAKFSDGSASEILREYPGHAATLLFRARSGDASMHESRAELIFVLAGNATLVTGGRLAGPCTTSAGETRSNSIDGGMRQELRSGDVVHIPTATPHQLLLTGDKTIACLILEIEETA
jgi:uncharacterized RmlC-like cupin family protein